MHLTMKRLGLHPVPEAPAAASDSGSDEISEEEFEKLLDELHGDGTPGQTEIVPTVESAAPVSTILRMTSLRLLDDLHGKGKFDSTSVGSEGPSAPADSAAPAAGGDSDLITDDEFENLLTRCTDREVLLPQPTLRRLNRPQHQCQARSRTYIGPSAEATT